MPPQAIMHRNILRVLVAGFALVILLLLAAAVVGVQNIHSIQQSAANLVREQSVTNRLLDELKRQQKSLSEVFLVLARDPESVDDQAILAQLDETGSLIERITAEGGQTADHALWERLRQSSAAFSAEARRLLEVEDPETFASLDLFRAHESFLSVVTLLIESEYRKVSEAQTEIDARSTRSLRESLLFACLSVALATVFAVFTVRLARRLTLAIEEQAAELGRVSWHMMSDQEDTARRFSHELHDELGQSLTAVKTNLAAMSADHGGARLEDSLRLVDEAIGNVRQMSQLLRPTILDDFGLEAGLRWLTEGFSMRTGIPVEFRSGFSGRLADQTETHLFRIAQEALTNVARHAKARGVSLSLEPAGAEIVLRIADDGRGMPPPAPPSPGTHRALGLIGMRARARSAGGDIAIHSQPGRGVVIEVRLPAHDETHSRSAG